MPGEQWIKKVNGESGPVPAPAAVFLPQIELGVDQVARTKVLIEAFTYNI